MNKYKILLLILRICKSILKYKMDDYVDQAISFELNKIIVDVQSKILKEI